MSDNTESPFRRDEPVSSSAKWLLISGICTAFTLLAAAVMAFLTIPPPDGVIHGCGYAAGAYYVLRHTLKGWQSSRLCREQRSFDVLASALRHQQRCWLLLALLCGVMAVGVLFFAFVTRHQNTGLRYYLEKQENPAASPATPPP
jgi:hypothetical protein